MAAVDFTVNPCRRSVFDVFRLDKSETSIRAIREAVREAKELLKVRRIVSRAGTILELTEAQLNSMEKRLFDPVERLKEEQIVHLTHLFTQDEQIVRRLASLEEEGDGLEEVLSDAERATLQIVSRLLPPIEESRLTDDLPWPEPPEPLALSREGFDDAILRDQ